MEGQPRANAAQMAARNIKQAKGRQRKTPMKSNGVVQQSMQFGGSGGMFGGVAPPASSFDFSAPGGMSFPPVSFANGNASGSGFSSPEISENEADPRADTTGEEILRRNRNFQTGDGPVLFHTPDAFGQVPSANTNPFGQAGAQEKPADNPFSFKPPTSQAPASMFGFTPSSNTGSNPFAFQQSAAKEPAPSATSFGATTSQDKPAANPFSFLSASSTPSVSSVAQPAQDKPASNIFAGLAQPAAPSSNFSFGAPAPQEKPASTAFVFGQSSTNPPSGAASPSAQPAEKPSSNLFGNVQQTPAPAASPFSFGQPAAAQPNIFGNTKFPASPNGNLFGNQKPAQSAGSLFGEQGQQRDAKSTTGASEPQSKPNTAEEPKPLSTSSANIFANVGNAAPAATNLFSNAGKQAAPATNMFAGLNTQTTPSTDLFGNLNKPVQQSLDSGSSLTNGTKDSMPSTAGPASQSLFSRAPSNANGPASSLFSAQTSSMPAFGASTPAMSFDTTNSSLNKPVDGPKDAGQSSSNALYPALPEPTQSPPKQDSFLARPASSVQAPFSNGLGNTPALKADKSHLYREMAAATRITEEFMRPLVPAGFNDEQRKEFYVAYRMRCLNKAMQGFFTTLSMGSEVSNAIAYYQEQRLVIMGDRVSSTTKSKRRAQHDGEERLAETFVNQNTAAPVPESRGQVPTSPTKPSDKGSQLFSVGTASPRASYEAPPAVAAPPSSTKGKRKAEVQLTKDDDEREETERRMKTPNFNVASAGGSNTSNIFKNIIDSPGKASTEKKVKSLPKTSEDDAPRFNPFATLPLPPSASPKPAAPTPSASNMFSPKPASEAPNPFSPKIGSGTSAANAAVSAPTSIKPPTFAIKPPTFTTGPVNFMAQFNQQASKSEEKLMQEAKDEDMDSDDDEAEWEANWKAKRKAELQAIEQLGKNKRATFTGGKFTFGQADSKANAAPSSGDSLSSSATGSRTPTPGIVGSSTGSVLDGHASGKPTSFVQNIFGHLSDADSGADNRKDADLDSDSGDEESEDAEDLENKDPSYQPGSQQSSSRTSPEEVGQGTVAAKKPLFDSGASKPATYSGATPNSGTSTPGGSLFDRITRDSSGNPVRHISSEEKENTIPSSTANVANTTNPFARSFDGAADQTWKPNSPIKFAAPTVNVTAATPTKQPSPFTNLFGNSGGSEQQSSAGGTPKPTSNLFAGLASSKSGSGGVGFNFGSGLSTTTSSLFPSAVVSATTSRATSPGGTTDGDSAAEGDPDAERHAQINLIGGGPGEEDEEVVHEIRAKALQWCTKDGAQWQTRGVGPLRVLKHKETGATRLLLRADPRGTIVLNKGLLAGVKYEVNEKTIKFPAAGEAGKGFETWLLQLKTPQFAKELGEVMESNKPSS